MSTHALASPRIASASSADERANDAFGVTLTAGTRLRFLAVRGVSVATPVESIDSSFPSRASSIERNRGSPRASTPTASMPRCRAAAERPPASTGASRTRDGRQRSRSHAARASGRAITSEGGSVTARLSSRRPSSALPAVAALRYSTVGLGDSESSKPSSQSVPGSTHSEGLFPGLYRRAHATIDDGVRPMLFTIAITDPSESSLTCTTTGTVRDRPTMSSRIASLRCQSELAGGSDRVAVRSSSPSGSVT